jgi:hypothetical protein
MEDLIRKIQIHLETTEECIENTSLPQYVVELLEADNKLLSEVVTNYQAQRMYSEEEVMDIIDSFIDNLEDYTPTFNSRQEWFEQFKKK